MSRASDLGRLEGVSKAWWQYDQTNTTTDGSFNVSSISDDVDKYIHQH